MRALLLLLGGLLSVTATTYAQRSESPWYAVDPGARVRVIVGGNPIDGTFSGVRNEGVVIIARDSMRVYQPSQIEAAFLARPQAWPIAEQAFLLGAAVGGTIGALTSNRPAVDGPKYGLAGAAIATFIGYFIGKSVTRYVPIPLH